jgi:hypothetical protein
MVKCGDQFETLPGFFRSYMYTTRITASLQNVVQLFPFSVQCPRANTTDLVSIPFSLSQIIAVFLFFSFSNCTYICRYPIRNSKNSPAPVPSDVDPQFKTNTRFTSIQTRFTEFRPKQLLSPSYRSMCRVASKIRPRSTQSPFFFGPPRDGTRAGYGLRLSIPYSGTCTRPCASSSHACPHKGIIVMTNAKVIRIIQNDEEK